MDIIQKDKFLELPAPENLPFTEWYLVHGNIHYDKLVKIYEERIPNGSCISYRGMYEELKALYPK